MWRPSDRTYYNHAYYDHAGSKRRTISARHDAGGCPNKRCIIVTSESGFSGSPLAAIFFFARDAHGNAKPAGEISGSNTTLDVPTAIAMDSHHNLYVTDWANSITVYAAGAEGNVAPIRSIEGADTDLYRPTSIVIDSHNRLYVAGDQRNRIDVYAPDASGDAAPIRKIAGASTNLFGPLGMAFDSQSNLYVANDNPNNGWVTVYAPGAKGNATPERTIEGSATKFDGPAGLRVDNSGYLYVVNSTNGTVAIFSPDANGNAAPISYFSAPIYAEGLALDGRNNMYVTGLGYDDPPYIAVFAAGTNGNEGDTLRTIEGKKTKLIFPAGILVR